MQCISDKLAPGRKMYLEISVPLYSIYISSPATAVFEDAYRFTFIYLFIYYKNRTRSTKKKNTADMS